MPILINLFILLFVNFFFLYKSLKWVITRAWEHNSYHAMLNVSWYDSKVLGIPEYLESLNDLCPEYMIGMLI